MGLDIIKQKESSFTLFSLQNFLDAKWLSELSCNFPLIEQFPQMASLGKFYMDSRNIEFHDFISSHLIWSKLIEKLNKQLFLDSLLGSLYLAPELDFLKNYPHPMLHEKFYSIKNDQDKKMLDELGMRFSFEFSSMCNGSYLPPHTDSTSKLLSILIYLPIDNNKSSLGTKFFKSKSSSPFRSWDSAQLADKKLSEFYSTHELLYAPTFELGNVVGFLKSDLSWHSVEAIECQIPIRRNSFNISLFINIIEQKIRLPF